MKIGWLDRKHGIARIEWCPFSEGDQIQVVLDALYSQDARVNLVIRWDGSYHDPSYQPYLIVGPGVQRPLSRSELMAKLAQAGEQWVRAFQLSRRAS